MSKFELGEDMRCFLKITHLIYIYIISLRILLPEAWNFVSKLCKVIFFGTSSVPREKSYIYIIHMYYEYIFFTKNLIYLKYSISDIEYLDKPVPAYYSAPQCSTLVPLFCMFNFPFDLKYITDKATHFGDLRKYI